MFKSAPYAVIIAALLLLTSCGGHAQPIEESNSGSNTITYSTAPNDKEQTGQEKTDTNPVNVTNFTSGLLINLKSYEDQLNDNKAPVLAALESNLISLVEHKHTLFRSGFVNEKLADSMEYYYGEQFQYQFKDIENIEQNLPHDKVHITVIGQRLDTTTGTVEDMKMLYAFQPNDQGEWVIQTID